jgi:guanylate kinase
MRKEPTPSERLLWRAVCGKQLGVRVRRQHPMHPYIVDFYVASRRLVVEVDGGVHHDELARARDAVRDAELGRLYGVRVMRIDAALVERNVFAAVALLRAAVTER